MRRRWILFAGSICGTHGGHETAEVCDGGGGAGFLERARKIMDGVSPGRPQSFRYQRRPVVDDCSPGQGGMAQDGGTRGGTFHGGMDHCRESPGWTTACTTSMNERDRKDEGNDGPKQGCSSWFARYR